MYYVYYGYSSPDNYDSEDPTHEIKEFSSPSDVESFRKEFDEDYLTDECSNVIFRVFEGVERTIKPKEVVMSYRLDDK
jgi:hypothetical protein